MGQTGHNDQWETNTGLLSWPHDEKIPINRAGF